MANSKNIWAATLHEDGGSFYRAPLGTPLPDDALDVLDAAFKDHGWMGDDGFKVSPKRDTTKHKAFGGSTVKTTQDNYECTVTATIYEQNIVTLKTVFGDSNVTVDYSSGHAKYRVEWSDAQLPRSSFIQRYIDGRKTALNVIEEGQIVEIEDIEYVHDQLVKFTVHIDVYKPESGNPGVYSLIDDPDATGTGS
ncbi:phage tail tube protein [Mycobacteroides abscessus]|uniref:phage tail tube protein n=1 Tax=Mycobacteroides abscessus TaxID=36809 RepID=UPI0009286B05|nr:hypothetical protein [Mycobacteroides abscessus]DAZ90350.1 TPA_asm: major tail protein [Mycobacterium phage prophiFSQJ01-1]SII41423.1 Phage associated (putative structural protein) [Mycobacteroides abscessus subsp. abscessus]SIK13752.1 Phage associated (putative structural protein) [Mycobacteroides abscessus subsp. abscessus]SIN25626.1 Phage associated (putative structural protein) [Mycobacteroides abscessus subsp. abscessus]SLI51296.1 Phage associated (putative structural protein) [Mycobac